MSSKEESIYYFKPVLFKEYIKTIADKTVPISDGLFGFRELPCLHENLKQMTVQEIAASRQLIQELYIALRAGMQPATKFKLPYKKAERERELIQNLAEVYNIDTMRAATKIITGHYDGDGIVFPYAIETVMAPRKDMPALYNAGKVEFIGNVNDSPAIDGGERYFSDGNYQWIDKKGVSRTASSVSNILHECGFDPGGYNISKKRVPCVVLLNLRTPIPDWLGSAGKSHINLNPYAEDIAKTISSLAYKMPSCHGKGFAQIHYPSYSTKDEAQIAIEYLRTFLKKRKEDVYADPSLKVADRLTQSGVWYRIRPVMVEAGFEPRDSWGKTRRTLTGEINKVCEELWPGENITREDLGIVASSKGVMLFNGEAWPINGDSIDALAEKGIAIIVIEKEGIADQLEIYAKDYGIALMHTGGRLTNAAKALIERAKQGKSVVRTLTDYDAIGMEISKSTYTITPRIGIDREIVRWLQEHGFPDLTEEDVEEEYSPNIQTDDRYLQHKRIELDSIQAKVGTKGLWEYVMHRLQLSEFSPQGFNLNKVIEMPETRYLYPEAIKNVLRRLDNYIGKVIEHCEEQIQDELEHVRELTKIKIKEKEVEEKLGDIVAEAEEDDEGMRIIVSRFTELMRPGVLPTKSDR
jgi:hypothetical protein